MAIFKCLQCGKEFVAKPSSNRKYCSRECMGVGFQRETKFKEFKIKTKSCL